MKRRDFVKLAATGMGLAGLGQGAMAKPSQRILRKTPGKKLLVIFQRGGNDALNTLIPINPSQHSLYMNYRPTLGVPIANTLNTSHSDFGLHPSLASIHPIHQAGNMSFVHCVGYPGSDRSHFESESYYETAVPGNTLLEGWINRYLQNTTGDGGLIRAVAIGSTAPQSVMGLIPVPTSSNFGTLQVGDDSLADGATPPGQLQQILDQIHDLVPTAGNQSVYETGQAIFQMVESFSDRNLDDYVPANGATYPDTYFGERIKHAAQMLKEDPSPLNIEVATVDMNGYDTHAQQNSDGGHADLMSELSDSLAALYTDMGSQMNDLLVLVVTEFGRRVYENDSAGTDHGTGGVAMIMSNSASGQICLGSGWPGLEEHNLYYGDLDWRNDFRDIYWEILDSHMGLSTSEIDAIIPGHSYTPLGII